MIHDNIFQACFSYYVRINLSFSCKLMHALLSAEVSPEEKKKHFKKKADEYLARAEKVKQAAKKHAAASEHKQVKSTSLMISVYSIY